MSIHGSEGMIFPALSELLDSVVDARVEQVMDASPWDLGLTVEDLQGGQPSTRLDEWRHIRAMVETAYRLGLKDGSKRVGDAP